MAETFKDLDALYKKCKQVDKGAVKEATTHAKTIKYFGYDMDRAIAELKERVLDAKSSAEEPIKSTKIEDFCNNQELKGLLKAVQWNCNKMTAAYKDLDKMDDDAGFGKANVKKLTSIQDKIFEAKKLNKKNKSKLDPKIQKLENQVNNDLKQIMDFWDVLDKITAGRRGQDPKKTMNAEFLSIAKAKPKPSPKRVKFNKLREEKLTKKEMVRTIKDCNNMQKEMLKQADLAIKMAENKEKGWVPIFQTADRERLKIAAIVKGYEDIKSEYGKQIDKSDSKKLIYDKIKIFQRVQKETEKKWEVVTKKVSKL